MIRKLALGIAVGAAAFAMMPPAPAKADIIVGSLDGIITNGRRDYYPDYSKPATSVYVTGQSIKINFITDVVFNYTDQSGNFYPKYVINTFDVITPALASIPDSYGLQVSGSFSTAMTPPYAKDSQDYVQFYASSLGYFFGSVGVAFPGNDTISIQNLQFYFNTSALTGGPVTGMGLVQAEDGSNHGGEQYLAYFNIVGGTFSVSAPEPAAWALMIIGFGGVGATLRRRKTSQHDSMA